MIDSCKLSSVKRLSFKLSKKNLPKLSVDAKASSHANDELARIKVENDYKKV